MTYKFEEFNEKDKRGSDIPVATITQAGNINLNKAFRIKYGDDVEGGHVIFSYDVEKKVIRLKSIYEMRENSYSFRELMDGKGFSVAARAFLNHFGIPFDKTRSYETKVENNEKEFLIYIYLQKKVKG